MKWNGINTINAVGYNGYLLTIEKFYICNSGAHTGADWHSKRLWPGDQHHLNPRRWHHNKNPSIWVCLYLFSLFVSNVFFLSNLSVQLCNGQDQDFWKTRTKRGGCKRGLCLAGFGQVITFIHSTVRPNDKKQDHPITSSWSSRVDELSIQFAEFRSNPVYIKVCNDPKHGSSVMVGRWTQDPYPMVLGTECLEPNPTLGVCHVATPSLQLCPALHCLALPQCRHL